MHPIGDRRIIPIICMWLATWDRLVGTYLQHVNEVLATFTICCVLCLLTSEAGGLTSHHHAKRLHRREKNCQGMENSPRKWDHELLGQVRYVALKQSHSVHSVPPGMYWTTTRQHGLPTISLSAWTAFPRRSSQKVWFDTLDSNVWSFFKLSVMRSRGRAVSESEDGPPTRAVLGYCVESDVAFG